MREKPSRAVIESALSSAFIETIRTLELDENSETLMMTFKALQNISFDIVEIGDAPRELVAQKLGKIAKRRLPRLQQAAPTLVMKPASA